MHPCTTARTREAEVELLSFIPARGPALCMSFLIEVIYILGWPQHSSSRRWDGERGGASAADSNHSVRTRLTTLPNLAAHVYHALLFLFFLDCLGCELHEFISVFARGRLLSSFANARARLPRVWRRSGAGLTYPVVLLLAAAHVIVQFAAASEIIRVLRFVW
jgi:uncharacterized membrane protein YecN with MAPEG domain